MSYIRNLCKDISFNRTYNCNNIPKRMCESVVENFGIYEENLILFYDSSVLETGKTGLAICDDGIYWRDISVPIGFLSWDEFVDTDIRYDDFYIYLDDKNKFFVFNRDIRLIIELLERLKASLEEDTRYESLAQVTK